MTPHGIAVLGSTGSIGVQTLDVVRSNPEAFHVRSLAAGSSVERLAEQVREFRPELVAVADEAARKRLAPLVPNDLPIEIGAGGLEQAATLGSVHTVLDAVVGFAGLRPALAAVTAGKNLALANKESLVAGGALIVDACRTSGARLAPVDSEHSSIFQCLNRNGCAEQVRRVILTASGGPFLTLPALELEHVRPEDAVKHPTWNMGAKISVDSATLMNKGLEVIEAAVLFGLPGSMVEVLIHPESIVHGFVEYVEGAMLAALFSTDMRVPIAYALKFLLGDVAGAANVRSGVGYLDLAERGALHFSNPDTSRFPALALCYRALDIGGTGPAILNAANEVAVAAFLQEKLKFSDITLVAERVLEGSDIKKAQDLEGIIQADADARVAASKLCKEFQVRNPRLR